MRPSRNGSQRTAKIGMTNAAALLRNAALRILVVGYPGTAKTGSLASLLNAGFKIRMIDFDGNVDPLLQYANPEALSRLDVAYFEDRMRTGSSFMEPIGIPQAFAYALKQLDDWKTQDADGNEISLGSSKDWGPDTIVVLDSLTKMGDAAFRRAMKLLNKTPANVTDRVWGLAMQEQSAFIEALTSANNKHHVIVLAHLTMIGPKDKRSGESDIAATIKEQIAEILPTRLYPSALGWKLPQQIGGEFPILLEAERITKGGTTTRTLNLAPKTLIDVKFPGALGPNALPSRLDISDGMLRVFKALSPGSVDLVGKELINA